MLRMTTGEVGPSFSFLLLVRGNSAWYRHQVPLQGEYAVANHLRYLVMSYQSVAREHSM